MGIGAKIEGGRGREGVRKDTVDDFTTENVHERILTTVMEA